MGWDAVGCRGGLSLWKGQCAEWGWGSAKVAPSKGCGLAGGGATAQLVPTGAQAAEMREMATKVRHREGLTQVITSFSFYVLFKNSLLTPRS